MACCNIFLLQIWRRFLHTLPPFSSFFFCDEQGMEYTIYVKIDSNTKYKSQEPRKVAKVDVDVEEETDDAAMDAS